MAEMRIFVSHSSSDKDFADALVQALRGAGADVWYDELHLGTGELHEEISHQIAIRPVFIVVLSKAALASQWVRRECIMADNKSRLRPGRKILPVVVGQIDPDDWDAMLWLADFRRVDVHGGKRYDRGETIEYALNILGLKQHLTALSHPLDNVTYLIDLGEKYLFDSRQEEAAELLYRATQLEPKNVRAWGILTDVLRDLGRDEEAVFAFDRLLMLEPGNAMAWYFRGSILEDLERFDEALDSYDHAIRLAPKSAFAWDAKADLLTRLSRNEEAIQTKQRADEIGTKGWASPKDIFPDNNTA